jgi:hypothetical protein
MPNRPSRRFLAAALAAAALVVATGGIALAASSRDATSPGAFLDSVAKHLGISRDRLADATKAAAKEQVDAAVAAGRLTEEQGRRLKERIDAGDAGPRFGGFGFGPGRGPGGFEHGFGHHLVGADHLSHAADYLDLSVAQLVQRLQHGRTLAEIAGQQGKPVEGLKDAIVAGAREDLDAAVADGRLTRDEADAVLAGLRDRIDDLVDRTIPGCGDRDRGDRSRPGTGDAFFVPLGDPA